MDKFKRIIPMMLAFIAIMAFLTGQWLIAGICAVVAGSVWSVVGGKTFNDRNVYVKKLETSGDLSVEELYEKIRDMETPLGKPWIAQHQEFQGKVIVFGPGIFKDYVTVGKKGRDYFFQDSTVLAHLKPYEHDMYRFDGVADISNMEVTAARYCGFASYKMIAAAMLEDMMDLVHRIDSNRDYQVPESMDIYKMFHYDTSDNIVKDEDGNEYASCRAKYEPLRVDIHDMDGNEIATVSADPDARSPKLARHWPVTIEGVDENHFTRLRGGADGYELKCSLGDFKAVAFRAVRKGNLSCNYRIFRNDILIGVYGANAQIEFSDGRTVQNNVICSFDDDYLTIFIVFSEFIMTLNKFIK